MNQAETEGLFIKDISKRFGTILVLDNVSLNVPPGRITALIGQNGTGKSTFFKILMGLVRADSGTAVLEGRDILSFPLHRKAELGMGYLPQDCASFPDLTVRENLQAIIEIQSLDRNQQKSRLEHLLHTTDLEPIANRAFKWLSGGEQRRLEIAKALVMQPKIVLLDEPFSGLDPGIVEGIIEVIRAIASGGAGILLTDHNIHMTLPFTDYAYLMAFRSVVCGGSPEEISSSDLARKLYLGKHFTT